MWIENNLLAEMLPGVERTVLKERPYMLLDINQQQLAENAQASVARNGNFTIAVIDYFGRSFVGVAKRNPLDTPNSKRGDRIALSRALKALVMSAQDAY